MSRKCLHCESSNLFIINTYKHRWTLCKECGCAYSYKKNFYLFSFLPYSPLRKNNAAIEEPGAMYDYFTTPEHLEYVTKHADDFINNFLLKHKVDLKGKKVLDISGGPGRFVKEFERYGATVAVTEINNKAIEYARNQLNIRAEKFDFATDRLQDIFKEKYDIILLGAALMFCRNLQAFLADAHEVLAPGGLLISHRCVEPTLGVLLRTQCDEYNYQVLYSQQTLLDAHEKVGLKLMAREDENDPELYVYDHDNNPVLEILHYLYEIPAINKMKNYSVFPFRARDRRRSHFIFSKSS